MRYEDLYDNPEPTLKGALAFLLALETVEGTVAGKRVDEIIAAGHKTSILYPLKEVRHYKSEPFYD